jgi:hypothetical protein
VDADRVQRALGAVAGDPRVERVLFELGEDLADRPAVWVWVVFADDTPELEWTSRRRARLGDRIRAALHEQEVPHWLHLRFRSATEQRELDAAAGGES